jgi:hypothetical protein
MPEERKIRVTHKVDKLVLQFQTYPVLEQWSLAWMFTEEIYFFINSSK